MADTPKTPSEISDTDAKFWLTEIDAAKKRNEDWFKDVEKAEKRYRDTEERAAGALNIFWANVETQKAALGRDFGTPQVSRINANGAQELARAVSMVLEQALTAAVRDTNDEREIISSAHKMLLSGQAQVWQELNIVSTDAMGNVTWLEAPIVSLTHEEYLEGLAVRPGDIPWKARRHLFSLDDLRDLDARNGTAHADKVPREYKVKGTPEKCKEYQFKRACVWEIWVKIGNKRRIYVAEGYDIILQSDDDPFRLKGFFPCPAPIRLNSDDSWQQPLTDYSRYNDQAFELDRICKRIFVLLDTLRKRGVYDKSIPELLELAKADDNKYIPVANYSDLQQKGGLVAALQTEDFRPTMEILNSLYQQRDKLIALIYELSGISDLARGMTNPNETLGAQQLKKSFGSGRFKAREAEVKQLAVDAYQIKGELIAEHFGRDQLQEMSGIALPTFAERQMARQQLQSIMPPPAPVMPQQPGVPPQQPQQQPQAMLPFGMDADDLNTLKETANAPFTWEKIAGVLQSDKRRSYTIDIETDQTAYVDEESDKKARIEFVNTFNSMIQTFMPMIAANPANGEILKRLIMFVMSRFKAGRAMEEGLEQSIDNAIKKAVESQGQQQAQQPADPVAQAQVALTQAQTQREMARVQTDAAKAQVDMQEAQISLSKSQAELQIKQAELQIKQQEVQAKAVGHQIDIAKKAEAQPVNNLGFAQQTGQIQPRQV